MTTAAPRRAELEIGAVAAVELAPVCECPEAQGAARVHEVLQLVAGPPVAARSDTHLAKDVKRVSRPVQETLEIHFETVAIFPIACEQSPLEPGGLPVPRA